MLDPTRDQPCRGQPVGSTPAELGTRTPAAGSTPSRQGTATAGQSFIAAAGPHPKDIFAVPHTSLLSKHQHRQCTPRKDTTLPPRHHPKDNPSSPHTPSVTPEQTPPVSHCRCHGEPPSRRRFDVDHPRAAAQRRHSEKVGAAGARPYGVICPIWVCPRGPFSGDISAHLFGPGRLV